MEGRAIPKFAKDTTVSVATSQAEIERTLERYGADSFVRAWDGDKAIVGFRLKNRFMRFILPLPSKESFRYVERTWRNESGGERAGQRRTDIQTNAHWEQACRQRWRALNLVIKAKLEAVDAGISTIEDEFLANIVLPSGDTVSHWMHPQIEEAYRTGHMPPMLPMLGSGNGS